MQVKFKKGLSTSLPAVEDGSLVFTTDDGKLYLDTDGQRVQIGGGQKMVSEKLVGVSIGYSSDGSRTGVINLSTDDYDYGILLFRQTDYVNSGGFAVCVPPIKFLKGVGQKIQVFYSMDSYIAQLTFATKALKITEPLNNSLAEKLVQYYTVELYKYV